MTGLDLRFHHLGVGTPRFDEALSTYEALGYRRILTVDDPGLDVRIGLLEAPHSPMVEIVAPLSDNGPLTALLARKQLPSPYHSAYLTASVVATSERLRDLGFMPLGEPKPAKAFGGALILYHYHAAIGLLELVEGPS